MTTFHFEDLVGKTILLTGTTRGIGKAILPELLEQGINLILLNRNMDAARQIQRHLGASQSQMRLYRCDLSNAGQVQEVAQNIVDAHIPIDAVVNNAAIDRRHQFENGDEALWQRIFQTNLFSAVTLTRYLLPQMRQRGKGRIIFTGSIMYELGGSFMTAYNSTKAALQGLTFSLAHELKHTGITVNCLVPGAIQVEKETGTPESNRRLTDWQAVGRRITPLDMLGPLCLLLSDAGGGISGQTITIDGGIIHPLADPDGQRKRLARDTAA